LDVRVLQELGVPRDGDFYICGPPGEGLMTRIF
jgi:hypothetical protein